MSTRTNLITNPSFETNTTGWTAAASTTIARSTAQAWTGTASMTLQGTGTIYAFTPQGTSGTAVTAGQSYTAQARYRSTVSRGAVLNLYWYNSAGTQLSTNSSTNTATSTSVWGQYTVTATAPVGAAYVSVMVLFTNAVNTETHYVDGVLLEQASSAGTYFDGSSMGGAWTGTPQNSTSTLTVGPPVASFTETENYLDVTFTNTSTYSSTPTYSWNFGDGATSTATSPTHTYAAAGSYTVSLTVTTAEGTNTTSQSIGVVAPPGPDERAKYIDILRLDVELSGTWTNVLGPTHEISVKRAPMDVGTLTALVLDSAVDPTVAGDMRPGIAVRLQVKTGASWSNVFLGTLSSVSVSYQDGTRVSLEATDGLGRLANIGEPRGVAEISELPYILSGHGIAWNINGSDAAVASATVVVENENSTLLDQILVTRDSNRGYAWIDRNNVLNVWDPTMMSTTAAATFTDVPGNLSYTDVDISFDLDAVINDVTVSWLRPNAFTNVAEEVVYGPFKDATSIAQWGARTASFRVQGLSTEADAATFATNVLNADATPVRKVNSLTTPVRTANEAATLGTLDLLAPVLVTRNGTTYYSHRVGGIEHSIQPDKWTMKLSFFHAGGTQPPQYTPPPPPQPVEQQAGTDGLPPATTPTPVVESGIQSLHVTWGEIDNPDPVTYDVYISATSGFTPGSTTYAGSTMSTYHFIRELPDGTPFAYSTTYYVRLVTRDKDGSGPVGAQGSGQVIPIITSTEITDGAISTPKLATNAVTTDKLAANAITAGKIQTGAITSDKLDAGAITGKTITGGTITGATIQTATSGQRVYFSPNQALAYWYPADGYTPGVMLASTGSGGYLQISGVGQAAAIALFASGQVQLTGNVTATTMQIGGSQTISDVVFGDSNITTNASGYGDFYHGLGRTPVAFMVSSRVANWNITVSTKTSNYVTLYVRKADTNDPVASSSASFEFIAIG